LPANEASFASAVTAMMMQYGYDGVEVDWEVTGAATQTNTTNMMIAMYNDIKALPNSTVDGKPRTLSFTTNPLYSNIYNMTTLGSYTDWCFYMGYDWYDNPTSYANGPLNGVNPAIATNIQALTNGSQWSYPISKMILGCPLYTNDYNAGSYYDVLSILHLGTPGAYNASYAEQAYTAPDGNTVYVDTAQSYCDKINWALGAGCKGIGLWDMAQALPYTDSAVTAIWNTIAGQASCLNLVPTATPTKTATPVVASIWRVDVGGSQYTDSQGNVWAADENYTGGAAAAVTNAIAGALPGTADQTLYQSQRYGSSFSYTFNVPAGSYQLTLKFAETYSGDFAKGDRLFNVAVNGTQVLTNFDIYATAGGNAALDEVFNNIAPSGGVITIQFTGTSSSDTNAVLEAIQIIPQPSTPTATNTATRTATASTTATPSLTASQTATNTMTNSATNTVTRTVTQTTTNTSTNSTTNTVTRTITLTETNTATNSTTPTPVPPTNTATLTASMTPSATASLTPTASFTKTGTISPTATVTNTNSPVPPTATATATDSMTPSSTFSVTPSFTPTSTPTNANTATSTNTSELPVSTHTYTNTPSSTNTGTPSETASLTFTMTPTVSPTSTFTKTPTVTSTLTSAFTPSATVTNTTTATKTASPTPTNTSELPTNTFTASPTLTRTAIVLTSTPTNGCSGIPNWNGNFVAYAIGQKVDYNGEVYQCIQAHTSESTWEPSIVPALWKDLGPCGSTVPTAQPVIYPNPASSTTAAIQLPAVSTSEVKIQMFTVAFRKVKEATISNPTLGMPISINLSDNAGYPLANGLYYVVVLTDQSRWVEKLLVLR
jgi:hypothetical protein